MTPERRLYIENPEDAVTEILAFLEDFPQGLRQWCEVFYPAPKGYSSGESEAWLHQQFDTFDAVELVDGVLVTLPPYTELA